VADVLRDESVDELLVEAVSKRRFVPTARQLETGAEMPAVDLTPLDEPAPKEAASARPPIRQRVVSYLRDVDPRRIDGPKYPILVFGLGGLFGAWGANALSFVAPEIRTEFGASVQTITTIGSVNRFVGLAAGIPLGYLADRIRRVYAVRVGRVLGAAGFFQQVLARNFGQYAAGQAVGSVAGLVSGPFSPFEGPLLADYYAVEPRARASAFLGACAQAGALIGTAVTGFLVIRYGWRQAAFSLGLLGLPIAAMAFFLKEPVRGAVDRVEHGMTAEQADFEIPPLSLTASLRAAWSIRTLRRQAYAGIPLGIAQTASVTLMILFLVEKFGFSPAQRVVIGEISSLVSLPVVLLSGVFAGRLLATKPERLTVIAGLVYLWGAISAILVTVLPSLWMIVPLNMMVGLVVTLTGPAQFTLTSMIVPANLRGVGMQVYTPFSILGIIIAPFIGKFADTHDLASGIRLMSPLYLFGALMWLSSASSVQRDIRAANAANAARDETRRARLAGQNKMLVCRDVDVEYEGVQVLFGVDFDVTEGEIVALLGTNGAGKSTLLRAIAGTQEAANGAIFLNGIDITHAPAHENAASGIVMMPGGQAVFPNLTVEDNLRTAAWMYRDDTDHVEQQLEKVLDFFPPLRERLDQPAGNLSGGEQQMVALSQAFLMRPQLLMIDELSLGLAPAIVEQLLGILREIAATGTTLILVEQSINVALTVAERAVFMEKGEIRFDGPTEELLRRPDLVRSVFMGGAVGGTGATRRRVRSTYDEPDVLLRVSDLSISFGGVHALAEVSLDVHDNEIVGIIGPNGAGKTTLFDAVSGHLKPDAGTIEIEGEDVGRMAPDARARLGLGRSFQQARLFPALTVRENIAVALERRAVKSPIQAALWLPKVRAGERRLAQRVDGLVELLGLEAYADKFARELSTGTRRAVDLACTMAAEPKVVLLDEPSSGLAQAESEALGPALIRVVRETGCGMLLIEHDMPLIFSVSDRLVAMELGRVLLQGEPEAVANDPRVLRSYLTASSDVLERSGSRVGAIVAALQTEEPKQLGRTDPSTTRRKREVDNGDD
jgi:ABC-type branched-subunit amino acid transport system ATPase component/MFS family permease